MAGLEDLFKGYDKARVEQAMQRAKALSEHPQVQEAFSRVDKEDITKMLRSMTAADKNQLMNTFMKGQSRELVELLKKLK